MQGVSISCEIAFCVHMFMIEVPKIHCLNNVNIVLAAFNFFLPVKTLIF